MNPLLSFDVSRLARTRYALAVRLALIALPLVAFALVFPWNRSVEPWLPLGVDLHAIFATVQIGLTFIVVPAIVAPAIAGERENGTLELLAVTTVSPAEIVTARYGALTLQAALILLAGIPVAFAAVPLGGITPGQVAGLAGHLLAATAFAAAVTVRVSVTAPTVLAATVRSVIFLAVIAVGSAVVGALLQAVLFSGSRSGPPGGIILLGVAVVAWFATRSGNSSPSARDLILLLCCVAVGVYVSADLKALHPGSARSGGDGVIEAVCPWALYYNDARADQGWIPRIIAWCVHIGGALIFVRAAALCLDEGDMVSDASGHAGRFDNARTSLRSSLVGAWKTRKVSTAPDAAAAEPAPRAPEARTLPVWPDAVLWKEIAWRRIPHLQDAVMYVAFVLTVSTFVSGCASGPRPGLWGGEHGGLLLDLALVSILAVLLAASGVAPERRAGMLPLLLAAGLPPARLISSKAKAVAWWLRPALYLLAIHSALVVLDLGRWGFLAAAVCAIALLDAVGVAYAVSCVARTYREALSGTLALLLGLWAVPSAISSQSRKDLGWITEIQPFSLIHTLLESPIALDGSAFSRNMAVFALMSAVFIFGPLLLARFLVERSVRA